MSAGFHCWLSNSESGIARFSLKHLLAGLLICSAAMFLTSCGNASNANTVTVYTSQDEEYADPLFKAFEKETGVKVLAVYDSEAVKTVGLANRILAERTHTQCDVFWNNEELRTRLLASKNVFASSNGWVLLGYRTRRMVINSNLVSATVAPARFSDATNQVWRGNLTLAYPLFGTTVTHFLALRQHWGDAAWRQWCGALAANNPFLVDGNSVAGRQVGSGEVKIGFTDSDDAFAEQREGRPVVMLPLSDESLVIHNTAGICAGAPHGETARKFLDYLQRRDVQQVLVEKHALESPVPAEPKTQPGLKVDWEALLADMDSATDEMKNLFLR